MDETVQQLTPSNSSELLFALTQNTEQLKRLGEQFDRLNERSRDFATRSDLEALRKELVAREALDPQLSDLRTQIKRVNDDRVEDRTTMDKRMEELEIGAVSRQDRLWTRFGQLLAVAAFVLTMVQLLSHLRFTP